MNTQRLHLILHTVARYFLATIFLMYAAAKIFGTQFTTQPAVWDKTVGELSGFELTWFYFGYSYGYGVFIATSQIIAALLLYFRQTTRVGIVLYLSIIVNILILDFAYEINGAQGMAILLTGLALFVFFSEFKAFYRFFIEQPPLFAKEERPVWLNKVAPAKYVLIPLFVAGIVTLTFTLKNKYMAHNEFFGTWKVKNTNSFDRWQRIYFQSANTFSVRGKNLTELYAGTYKFDKATQTISLQAFKNKEGNIDVLNVDQSQMYNLLKANYIIHKKELSLNGKEGSIKLEKVR